MGAFVLLPTLLEQLGGDANAALFRSGLAPDALDDPERHVPYLALTRCLDEAVRQTGCTHFGLLVGRACRLSDLGLLGEVVRNTSLVGTALTTLTIHQHLNSEGGMPFLKRRGPVVDLGYAVYHPDVRHPHQICDVMLAAGCNFMRELAGPDWRPLEVLLPHKLTANAPHYRNLFQAPPRFSAEMAAIRFPAHWLEGVVAGADAALRRSAEARIRAISHPGLIQEVHRALRRLFLDDRHSGDDVATMLAMNRRTLNRRLHAHGTTFQRVLDSVRYDLARQLLASTDVSLDDIAATLGYAGVSPFMRTFRRWSGETPASWRRASKKLFAECTPHELSPAHAIAPPARASTGQPARRQDARRFPLRDPVVDEDDKAGVAEDSDRDC